MPGAADRGQVSKIGPRVLSFLAPPLAGNIQHNCPKKLRGTSLASTVLGPDATPASVALLVNGWYRLQASSDVNLWVAQVNPDQVSGGDPKIIGTYLLSGDTLCFFVDGAARDGVLLVSACSLPTAQCNASDLPILIVNRWDTILPMAQTGDTLGNTELQAQPSRAC